MYGLEDLEDAADVYVVAERWPGRPRFHVTKQVLWAYPTFVDSKGSDLLFEAEGPEAWEAARRVQAIMAHPAPPARLGGAGGPPQLPHELDPPPWPGRLGALQPFVAWTNRLALRGYGARRRGQKNEHERR